MILRCLLITQLLLKEQLKEPIAFFWIIISPSLMFYIFSLSTYTTNSIEKDYLSASGWHYSYVASTVAFFGFSLYIIGRRESGFIRSFIYTKKSKSIFISSHCLAYSLISIIYCTIYYTATKPVFGPYASHELFELILKFYICFLLFCIPGYLITFLPLNFQNAHNLMSLLSLLMLAGGLVDLMQPDKVTGHLNVLNPVAHAKYIMTSSLEKSVPYAISIPLVLSLILISSHRWIRINPIWSRY